jgi:hypothetical protein
MVDLRHPADREQLRIPITTKNARKVWRSRDIERPVMEIGCIAHTLR